MISHRKKYCVEQILDFDDSFKITILYFEKYSNFFRGLEPPITTNDPQSIEKNERVMLLG